MRIRSSTRASGARGRSLMAGALMARSLMAGSLMARSLMAGGLVAGSVLGGVALGSPAAGADACVADGAAAVRIATPAPALGDTIEITGSGWCHPEDGGSRIAIKIDQGAYIRPDSTVHANRSIWAIVDADDADGSFTTTLELPDGTEATSTPVFTEEAHTLQLLTGSLKPGDVIRSVISPAFTVGGTTPTRTPTPSRSRIRIPTRKATSASRPPIRPRSTSPPRQRPSVAPCA